MNIKNILQGIREYYQGTRQIGHTTKIIEAAAYQDLGVVCHSHKHARDLDYRNKTTFKSACLSDFESGCMRGRKDVLVFDNAAMDVLASQSLACINNLEDENDRLIAQVESLSKISAAMLTRNLELIEENEGLNRECECWTHQLNEQENEIRELKKDNIKTLSNWTNYIISTENIIKDIADEPEPTQLYINIKLELPVENIKAYIKI